MKLKSLAMATALFLRKPPRSLPKWYPCLQISAVHYSTIRIPAMTRAEIHDRMTEMYPSYCLLEASLTASSNNRGGVFDRPPDTGLAVISKCKRADGSQNHNLLHKPAKYL